MQDKKELKDVSNFFSFFSTNSSFWQQQLKQEFGLEVPSEEDPQQYFKLIESKFTNEMNVCLNCYVWFVYFTSG